MLNFILQLKILQNCNGYWIYTISRYATAQVDYQDPIKNSKCKPTDIIKQCN